MSSINVQIMKSPTKQRLLDAAAARWARKGRNSDGDGDGDGVPQVQIFERVMEVPQVQIQEVVRNVPRVVQQEVIVEQIVPSVQTVQKMVEVLQIQRRRLCVSRVRLHW